MCSHICAELGIEHFYRIPFGTCSDRIKFVGAIAEIISSAESLSFGDFLTTPKFLK